jgi:hypothetical protein
MREMLVRDQNNAAIIGWSVANEPQSQLKEARAYFESLIGYCREQLHDYTLASGRFLYTFKNLSPRYCCCTITLTKIKSWRIQQKFAIQRIRTETI